MHSHTLPEHYRYSRLTGHKQCLGSAIIPDGCNHVNQRVTGNEKGSTANMAFGGAILRRDENQSVSMITESNPVNLPSLRGEPLQVTASYPQNQADIIWEPESIYESFVGQSGANKKGGISNPSPWTASKVYFYTLVIKAHIRALGCAPLAQLPADHSLGLLRWRRLISPLTAVTINCALVSPSTNALSISATTSCGKRALSCCDLLLIEPVAITGSPSAKCDSVYKQDNANQYLKCDSPKIIVSHIGESHLCEVNPINSEARQCVNTSRASYQTVNRGNDHG